MNPEVIVGITGASGSLFAMRLLRALEEASEITCVHAVVSRHARTSMREELGAPATGALDWKLLTGVELTKLREHPLDAVAAVISSGSHPTRGMAIVPCSMGTLARIASGASDSLLTRAADVCLKERRPLILAVRETPLNRIHLRNMLEATDAGATVMPIVPALYAQPRSIEEMVDQYIARVLDHLGVSHAIGRRWHPRGDGDPAHRS